MSELRRVVIHGATIPDITAADFDNPLTETLVTAEETVDREVEAIDGTPAQVPRECHLTAIKLQGHVRSAASGNEVVRWMLVKNIQDDLTGAGFMTRWQDSEASVTAKYVRGATIAKGQLQINANTVTPLKCFIRRSALRRNSFLNEDDDIAFVIAKDATGTTCSLELWGQIYFRH